jgi:DNA topoisomerase-1
MKKKVKKVSEENLCINRRPYGRGYRYYDENDKAITDKKLLKRLRGLIIPPMWDDVMICNWEDGHIQATGRDASTSIILNMKKPDNKRNLIEC